MESIGNLRVQWAKYSREGVYRYDQSYDVVPGKKLRVSNGPVLTPRFDSGCEHLTFVEFPTLHLSAGRTQLLKRGFYLTWLPRLQPTKPDDMLSSCQENNLKRFFDSPEEQGMITQFFLGAKSKESCEARQARFATQPLEAYKGFRQDLTCLDFQYRAGETFNFKDIRLGKQGAHANLWPMDVFKFYPREQGHRYFRVVISGAKEHGKYKSVAERIELVEELAEEDLARLSGVFEKPNHTILRLRGAIVGHFSHTTGDVFWFG